MTLKQIKVALGIKMNEYKCHTWLWRRYRKVNIKVFYGWYIQFIWSNTKIMFYKIEKINGLDLCSIVLISLKFSLNAKALSKMDLISNGIASQMRLANVWKRKSFWTWCNRQVVSTHFQFVACARHSAFLNIKNALEKYCVWLISAIFESGSFIEWSVIEHSKIIISASRRGIV